MNRTFRSAALLIAAASIAWLPTITSWGVGPKVPHGESSEIISPAGEYCAFALRIMLTSAAQVRPGSPGGDLIITGAFVATVTNLQNGKVRTYNISGPTFVDGQTGQLTLTGNALIGQPASVDPNNTFLVVTSGKWTFFPNNTAASTGTIAHDVCAELG